MSNPLAAAAAEVEQFCRKQNLPCCVIGGLAVQRWGEPRTTVDVDFTSLSGLGHEARLIRLFGDHFQLREEFTEDIARIGRVILFRASNGTPVDLSLAYSEYEKRVVERSSPFKYSRNTTIMICSADDLVVLKAFAARPRDMEDLRGVLVRQHGKLDWNYITANLAQLGENRNDMDVMHGLTQLRKDVDRIIRRIERDPTSPKTRARRSR